MINVPKMVEIITKIIFELPTAVLSELPLMLMLIKSNLINMELFCTLFGQEILISKNPASVLKYAIDYIKFLVIEK